ncbi:hypothetical protein WA026_003711 [Henosepilachna vigintioctopunctata]|uniref:Leucine-rich PPR motif-containing protein, mitochondrial n=1 Tax=Henosepilachna vigintioctopunctata TaxID=420089 RepID=A0AAW1UFG0_9CUCU
MYRKFCFQFIRSITTNNLSSNNVKRLMFASKCKSLDYGKHSSSFHSNVKKETISNFDDLVNYVAKRKWVSSKYILEMLGKIESDSFTEEHVISLLECSGKTTPAETFKTRTELCDMVLQKYEAHLHYSEKVYQTYINMYTCNKQLVDIEKIISLGASRISLQIMKSLLRNVCEKGDTEKAMKVLSKMKANCYPLDEDIFNNLILCNTIKGGLTLGQPVLQTMVHAKIPESNNSWFAIVKGVAQRKQLNEFTEVLDNYPISFDEDLLIDLLDSIGFAENHNWIKYIMKFVKPDSFSSSFFYKLGNLRFNLIQNGKYDSAVEIYKTFIQSKPGVKYGVDLMSEMLNCSVPVASLVDVAKRLKACGLNDFILEDVTIVALTKKLTVSAMGLLKHLDTIRPHYFWPLLVEASKNQGEKGLMDVMQYIDELNVKLDDESFQTYIFPFCDLSNPKRVINIFQKYGYGVKTLLTPMLVTLLTRNETKLALATCDAYNVQIGSEDLQKLLPYTWVNTADTDTCLHIIQKISEFQKEVVLGDFLINILFVLKNPSKLKSFLGLLKDSKKKKLLIDTYTAEKLISILRKDFASCDILEELESSINELLDLTKITDVPFIIHPSNMNTEELECHLIELKAKAMETRGVLRKLIQKHTNEGNIERVKQLENELISNQYATSPGLRASLMHTYIKEENLSAALEIYHELKQNSPNFNVDGYKLIDLATLLVRNNRFDEAADLLTQGAKTGKVYRNIKSLRNCRLLLSSIQDIDLQKTMFDILMKNGYCIPHNALLGCLIELHIEKTDLKTTVDMFDNLARQYRKTPMQLILLTKALECRDQEQLQRILHITSSIHGTKAAHSAMISALCEKNYKKQLIDFLQKTEMNPCEEMEKRCERWVALDQIEPLQTLYEVSREVPQSLLNRPKIQLSIMQLYSKHNDCDGALQFRKYLIDSEEIVSPELDIEFYNLLDRCKYTLPNDLEMKYRIK